MIFILQDVHILQVYCDFHVDLDLLSFLMLTKINFIILRERISRGINFVQLRKKIFFLANCLRLLVEVQCLIFERRIKEASMLSCMFLVFGLCLSFVQNIFEDYEAPTPSQLKIVLGQMQSWTIDDDNERSAHIQ